MEQVAIDGRVLNVSPMTMGDLGKIQQFVMQRKRAAIVEEAACFPEAERAAFIKESLVDARKMVRPDEILSMVIGEDIELTLHLMMTCLVKDNPDLTKDDLVRMFSAFASAEKKAAWIQIMGAIMGNPTNAPGGNPPAQEVK